MVVRSTSHHLLVEVVIIHDTPDMSPNIVEYLVMRRTNALVIRIMFVVTKFDKIHKLS